MVYSEDPQEHEGHVKKILSALQENKLFTKLEKCEFNQSKVEYLGFIVSAEGVSMDLSHVETITNWPTPTSVQEVQTFLGFCNFYQRFIARYSKMSAPLSNLTRKDSTWQWKEREEVSFQALKEAFQENQVMRPFNSDLPIFIETDSSGYTLARIASQSIENSHHPFAFFSRKMNPAKRNYVTSDQELLMIVASFKAWRQYLEGVKHTVVVISDHNNLQYFLKSKPLSHCQAHWAEFLSEFNFVIHYRVGSKNPADPPSRRPDYQPTDPEAYTLVPFFKLAEDQSEVQEGEVLLLLDKRLVTVAKAVTNDTREAGKQAIQDSEQSSHSQGEVLALALEDDDN